MPQLKCVNINENCNNQCNNPLPGLKRLECTTRAAVVPVFETAFLGVFPPGTRFVDDTFFLDPLGPHLALIDRPFFAIVGDVGGIKVIEGVLERIESGEELNGKESRVVSYNIMLAIIAMIIAMTCSEIKIGH